MIYLFLLDGCVCVVLALLYVWLCLQLMCELGNSVINHIYEGTCEEQGTKKPGANSPRWARKTFTLLLKLVQTGVSSLPLFYFTHLTDRRQEKEAWIRAKYVEKKFLKKMATAEALANSERKSERRWAAKKCRRHNSAITVPKHRRKYRQDPMSSGDISHL